ncbi:MAG: radical SAM protein, partial [bacterium]
MNFSGIQKITLIDYPGKVATTLFTYGCNFRCPFCHNPELVIEKKSLIISEKEVLDFLKSRVGKLDGVVITGGEPLLHTELKDFLKKVKDLGF